MITLKPNPTLEKLTSSMRALQMKRNTKNTKKKETRKEKNSNGTGEHIQIQIEGFKIHKKSPIPPTPVQQQAHREYILPEIPPE